MKKPDYTKQMEKFMKHILKNFSRKPEKEQKNIIKFLHDIVFLLYEEHCRTPDEEKPTPIKTSKGLKMNHLRGS